MVTVSFSVIIAIDAIRSRVGAALHESTHALVSGEDYRKKGTLSIKG
jgi:hypothetical protein